jgi:hypothetical protein
MPGGSVRAGAAVALDRQQINAWLADDALFNIWTIDQTGWIDPFTGAVIKSQHGSLKAPKRHLLKNRPWMKFGLRTLPELQAIRWGHHLPRLIEMDGRLRIFRKDGTWLNPYDGRWVGGIPLENGKVTYDTVKAIAEVVAKCPEAQERGTLLDAQEIARIINPPPGSGTSPSGRLLAMPAGPQPHVRQPGQPTPLPIEAPEERNTDLHRAKAVLEKMLPQIPEIPGWEVGVCWEPCSVIGGDFYDLIRVDPRHVFFAIGDVSGHGTSAALVVASTLKSLRHAVKRGGNLVDIVGRFNDDIHEDLLKSYFITMFAALIDVETKVMTCVCAGHHPAFIANPKRRVILSQIGNPAPAIGLMKADVLLPHMEPMTVQLKAGDTVLQYTDGLYEATNAERQEYGRNRVMAAFLLSLEDSAEVGVKRMVGGARKFSSDRFADDVTAIALKVLER